MYIARQSSGAALVVRHLTARWNRRAGLVRVRVGNPAVMAPADAKPKFEMIDGTNHSAKRKPRLEVVSDEPDQTNIVVGEDGTITIGTPKPPVPQASPESDFNRNLAKDMDEGALAALASYLLEGIEADLESRRDWADTANRAADYLGIKLQDPTTSVSADGTVCKSIATCMLEAAIKLWGTARAELLPVGGPVKVEAAANPALPPVPASPGIGHNGGPPLGVAAGQAQPPQSEGSEDDFAAALEADLNWYLTVRDREYYPDFSKMLISRAVIGNAFRKVFRCPLRRRPVSVWVRAQDLIVSNDCSHMQGAGRITERVRVRQSIMRRLQVAGHYLDIPLVMPTGETTETEIAIADTEGIAPAPGLPQDFEHLVFETLCELGSTAVSSLVGDLRVLDEDENGEEPGYPLPYRVSIDRDSRQILEIRRNWKRGDIDHTAKRRYVKYGFIPGFGFYDWGLIHMVGNPTLAATMLQRACVDSTLFANFPGGVFLKGPGSRQTNTVIRPNPGEFIGIDASGAARVQDMFMPMPYRAPGADEIGLEQKFEADVRRIAGVIELPVGEGRVGNTPVGTMMAYIESVSMVPGAVHKDDHIVQAEEFELLRELLAEEPEQLTRGNRSPARQAYTREELMSADLSPQADPNTPSEIHRLMKVQGLVAAGGLPQFQGIADQRKIWDRTVRQLTGGDPDEYTIPPAPPQQAPPDPKLAAAQLQAETQNQANQTKLQVAQISAQAKTAQSEQDAEQRSLDRQSEEDRAAMQLAGKRAEIQSGALGDAADRAQDQSQHEDTHGLEQAKLGASFSAPFTAPAGGGNEEAP